MEKAPWWGMEMSKSFLLVIEVAMLHSAAAHRWWICFQPRFFTWFDHQSWYPLGRPVATSLGESSSLFISFHPPGTAHFFGSLVFTFKSSHPDLAQYERIPRPLNETNSASIIDQTNIWFSQLCTTSTARSVTRIIYPGMQITAVLLWQILQNFDSSWDLNNVCCYMPAWFLDKH